MDAKILLVVQQLHPAIILKADCTALDSVEHLGSMEAKHRSIAKASGGHAFILHSKGMSCIVDYLQAVFLCNSINFLNIANVSIHMYWNDSYRAVSDKTLDLRRIHGIVSIVHITEHRYQPIANNRMSGRSKGKRRSDHLAALRQIQGSNGIFQSQMTVGIKSHMGHIQIFLQLCLQLLMLYTHIGQPVTIPESANFFYVLIQTWHRRACH